MKVPLSYVVSKAFYYMEGKESKTTKYILEMISANKEEIDISVAVLGFVCNTTNMYEFASEILQNYGTKEEKEEFLSQHEKLMKGDAPNAYNALKMSLFIGDSLEV